MNRPMTITTPVNFRTVAKGRLHIVAGPAPSTESRSPGRVPRVARLLALALHFEQQVRSGEIANYRELADLGHVTRARISQILNLVCLAPDIQEAILFLPRTEQGRDPIHLAQLQSIATTYDWTKQRRLWQTLLRRGVRFCGLGAAPG